MRDIPTLLAYFSPETALPVTSIIATVFGLVMMFGRTAFRFVVRGARGLIKGKRSSQPAAMKGPHRPTALRKGTRQESGEGRG
jgi:hypothetical protein